MRGRRDGEAERRLQVGLVEHREHPVRLGDRELGVQVCLVVDRVDEAVQALTRVRVGECADHPELVLGSEAVEPNARAVARRVIERMSVQHDLVNLTRRRLDEGRRARGRAEPHDRLARERLGAARQVERDGIVVDVDGGGAGFGLASGEIGSRHG